MRRCCWGLPNKKHLRWLQRWRLQSTATPGRPAFLQTSGYGRPVVGLVPVSLSPAGTPHPARPVNSIYGRRHLHTSANRTTSCATAAILINMLRAAPRARGAGPQLVCYRQAAPAPRGRPDRPRPTRWVDTCQKKRLLKAAVKELPVASAAATDLLKHLEENN